MRNKAKAVLFVGLLCTGITFVCGCSKKEPRRLTPARSPMAAYIHFEYAVYMMPVHLKDPDDILRPVLTSRFPKLKLVSDLASEPKEMMVKVRKEHNPQENYTPPSRASLHYSSYGLGDKEMDDLQKTREAFVLDFAHPKESAWAALHVANELVEEIARETGGLVWDEETREVYSPDAWHKQRIGEWKEGIPNISTQIVIHLYENGEFLRAISLGMTKAGLPDVVVEELPEMTGRRVGNLIDLFAQSMVEGRSLRENGEFRLDLRAVQNASLRDPQLKSLKSNATGIACLTLKDANPEEGDPKNRIIELAFDRYEGNDKHAKQDAAISWLFGWEDAVTNNVDHTVGLLEESSREKSKLAQVHRDFDTGLQPGEYILVKAPFDVPDGGREWMWVEVRKWRRGAMTGVLQNQPERIPNLHDGQVVEVREQEVFDYVRHYADGHEDGNTTGAMIRKMGQRETESQTGAKLPPPSCFE